MKILNIAFFLIFILAACVQAQDQPVNNDDDILIGPARIGALGGNLRAGKSISSELLIKLEKGSTIELFDYYDQPFFKAKHDTLIGFISSAYVTENRTTRDIKIKRLQDENPNLARLMRKYSENTARKIYQKEVWVGMTEQMLIDSWGRPNDRNITENIYGKSEQWVYNKGRFDRNYVYVENGVVTTIQR